MSKISNKKIGTLGEEIVCRYLKNKRFSIISTNYREKFGEIDVIAKDGQKIHFIEVKSVSCENLDELPRFRPEENVHKHKQGQIKKVIESYLSDKKVGDWQIDVMAVFIDQASKRAIVKPLWNLVFE